MGERVKGRQRGVARHAPDTQSRYFLSNRVTSHVVEKPGGLRHEIVEDQGPEQQAQSEERAADEVRAAWPAPRHRLATNAEDPQGRNRELDEFADRVCSLLERGRRFRQQDEVDDREQRRIDESEEDRGPVGAAMGILLGGSHSAYRTAEHSSEEV